jgi:hypothetical protein
MARRPACIVESTRRWQSLHISDTQAWVLPIEVNNITKEV